MTKKEMLTDVNGVEHVSLDIDESVALLEKPRSIFDPPSLLQEYEAGLKNTRYILDGVEISSEEFARLFPHLRELE